MKILLADDDAERANAVARILAADAGLSVTRLECHQSLAEAVASAAPDVVLVDMARLDRDTLDGIRQVAALNSWPVVLFVDQDAPHFMEEAITAGVSSDNAIGMPPPDVKPILRAAVALFRRHQHPRQDLKEAQSRLQERALIDRALIDWALIDWALIDWALIDWAKALLIKQRRLSEPDAYEWFRRNAMSSSRRIVDVASEVVKGMEGNTG